eukprot:3770873-Rhodomonas_salina.3
MCDLGGAVTCISSSSSRSVASAVLTFCSTLPPNVNSSTPNPLCAGFAPGDTAEETGRCTKNQEKQTGNR